jgi:cytochrome c-type biogenesis protein CcmE
MEIEEADGGPKGEANSEGPRTEIPEAPQARRRLGKWTRLLIVVVVVVVLVVVVGWSMTGKQYMTVGELLDGTDRHEGSNVTVQGKVADHVSSGLNFTFKLKDDTSDGFVLVRVTGTEPTNFEEGKDVVVTGVFRVEAGGFFIDAHSDDVKVGCASRY